MVIEIVSIVLYVKNFLYLNISNMLSWNSPSELLNLLKSMLISCHEWFCHNISSNIYASMMVKSATEIYQWTIIWKKVEVSNRFVFEKNMVYIKHSCFNESFNRTTTHSRFCRSIRESYFRNHTDGWAAAVGSYLSYLCVNGWQLNIFDTHK